MLDLQAMIRGLRQEKEKLERIIAGLEAMQNGTPAPRFERRGRKKGMSEEERREVSERMRKYWERWRAGSE